MAVERISVSLFCGGRGGTTLIREFLKNPQIDLNLLVNAYDDGLSTGEMRNFIPGMLGPSDFRKNLSYLLDFSSNQHFVLAKMLEYRLPLTHGADDAQRLFSFVSGDQGAIPYGDAISRWFRELDAETGPALREYVRTFLEYYFNGDKKAGFPDFALGNLIFAGAYLKHNRSFNGAAAELSKLFSSRANLINVTQGENRILVAVKDDGELLANEAAIVGKQSPSPIDKIFLLQNPLTPEQKDHLARLDARQKIQYLAEQEARVQMSPEARQAISRCDLIVYGPGTMFSSLFPSYKTTGFAKAIHESRARARVFIVNVGADHDIQGLSARQIMGKALEIMGDPHNTSRLITHAVYNEGSDMSPDGVRFGGEAMNEFLAGTGIQCIRGDFAHPDKRGAHGGLKVVRKLLAILDESKGYNDDEIEIYVDLNERSVSVEHLIQEFRDLDWKRSFDKVSLRINRQPVAKLDLPDHLEVTSRCDDGLFPEVAVFSEWLSRGTSGYLATITGDGGYFLRDILGGVIYLRQGPFGAVFGSRTQSRRQFANSLAAAYGEKKFLFLLSWMGAFLLSALFGFRFNLIFSDPLTGFRIYKRSALSPALGQAPLGARCTTASGLTRLMVQNSVEIAEIPVRYRTFRGFTNVRWRLHRGFRNLLGIYF